MDDELVAEYLEARMTRDNAQIRLDEISERLMKQMRSDRRKSYRWEADGVRNTLTYVRSHTTRIDEKGLRRALRARIYDRYTFRKLDRKALEDAMGTGEVDPKVVAPYITEQPNLPHLLFKATPTGAPK